jgi:hypothetical protein
MVDPEMTSTKNLMNNSSSKDNTLDSEDKGTSSNSSDENQSASEIKSQTTVI